MTIEQITAVDAAHAAISAAVSEHDATRPFEAQDRHATEQLRPLLAEYMPLFRAVAQPFVDNTVAGIVASIRPWYAAESDENLRQRVFSAFDRIGATQADVRDVAAVSFAHASQARGALGKMGRIFEYILSSETAAGARSS